MKKIAVVFGTRPEAIKLAPVILALKQEPKIECRVLVTAQHREMLDQVLEIFEIRPDVDLDLMRPNQTLGDLTARAVAALDQLFARERPDLVLVQGDTTTTFCAALAAFYHRIPVGHVEAGLRTGDYSAPWPEEANRVLTSHIACLHFAPTEINRQNLQNEGVSADRIYITGNTVVDAILYTVEKVRANPPKFSGISVGAKGHGRRLVLITGHRRENFGPRLESICRAVAELARCFPEVDFVYPVHLNPRVEVPVRGILEDRGFSNVVLIPPVDYFSFVALMDRATFILTDSGGIQEEAPSLGKPVLLLRDKTERPEAVSQGGVKLVGADFDRIVFESSILLSDNRAYVESIPSHNPFGDGHAAERITEICMGHFGMGLNCPCRDDLK